MAAPKVLVLYPAGQVRGRDSVEWYDQDQASIIRKYFNIGDMVVYDSTLKMLDYSEIRPLKIIAPTEADLELYKSYDFAVLRASNFVNNQVNVAAALAVLERLPIPVYAIGVGAQAADGRPYALTGANLRFWQLVAERSRVIGVRGHFTAEVLHASGIHNVEVCGCPSIFRSRNRNLRIEQPAAIRNLAVSIRREVGRGYAANPAAYLRQQRALLLAADERYHVTMTTHGEPEEKAFFYGDEAAMQEAEVKLRKRGWFSAETEAQLRRLYAERQFFFLKVAEYDSFIRSQDFALGLRVHGVLPALANGVPSLLISYDSRSTELANTHGIPTLPLEQAAERDVAALLEEADFSAFNRLYKLRYDKMAWTLEANGIPHRL